MTVRGRPYADRLADLPAVAQRVIDPSQRPAALFGHGADFRCTGGQALIQPGQEISRAGGGPQGASTASATTASVTSA